jgi:hypothetical protein
LTRAATPHEDAAMNLPSGAVARVRVCYFNTWARELEDAGGYVARAAQLDLRPLVSNPNDAGLLQKARLDCDWYAENARCFAHLSHPQLEFLPAWVCGVSGLLELTSRPRDPGEQRWLIFMGQQPQSLGASAGKVCGLLSRMAVRICYYAFDEASRTMPCFGEIAPFVDVLIHDEQPLDPAGAARLKPGCRTQHRSWVANVIPFAVPFNDAPEDRILFLGSQLGLTPHRQRQIDFLRREFKDRFVAYHDHSVAVADRGGLNRFKVSLCPEGRKFGTPAMATSHTDRPFWSGCLGLVPVSEDAQAGGRLEELHRAGLILRYAHADLPALRRECERALATPLAERRRIYDQFNREETVGRVVADAIASATVAASPA